MDHRCPWILRTQCQILNHNHWYQFRISSRNKLAIPCKAYSRCSKVCSMALIPWAFWPEMFHQYHRTIWERLVFCLIQFHWILLLFFDRFLIKWISKFQFPGLNIPPIELPVVRPENRIQQMPIAQPIATGTVLTDNQRGTYDLCGYRFTIFFRYSFFGAQCFMYRVGFVGSIGIFEKREAYTLCIRRCFQLSLAIKNNIIFKRVKNAIKNGKIPLAEWNL